MVKDSEQNWRQFNHELETQRAIFIRCICHRSPKKRQKSMHHSTSRGWHSLLLPLNWTKNVIRSKFSAPGHYTHNKANQLGEEGKTAVNKLGLNLSSWEKNSSIVCLFLHRMWFRLGNGVRVSNLYYSWIALLANGLKINFIMHQKPCLPEKYIK